MKKNAFQDPKHVSGHLHATGQSIFVGDDKKPANMLFAKPVVSAYARAKVLKIDSSKALALEGVVTVLTAKDIPGENNMGHFVDVEPILVAAEEEAVYVGQPIALVVAENEKIAKAAVKLVDIEYKELTPLLSFEEAIEKESFYIPKRTIVRGDVEKGLKESEFVLEGEINTGAQEHLYFETQRSWAIPEEGGAMTLNAATQGTATVQHIVANVLNKESKEITVDVKRLGGGFGGKEEGNTLWSCLAALAAHHTKCSVEIKLDRVNDLSYTAKRHPFKGKYKIGFTKEGKIIAYDVELYSNGGALVDISIPVFERAILFADNSYYIPHLRVAGAPCRTNTPPNTAFRGFGAPQAVFTIEHAIHAMARHLNMDIVEIREKNLYQLGQTTHYEEPVFDACLVDIFKVVKEKSQYQQLRKETDEFNRNSQYKKRGLAVVPIKFGLSFTQSLLNQASALIWIYTDGSISVSHCGIEMGQELNTKVAQVVSKTLGVPIEKIRIESSNTKRTGNASPTAASTGADLNCNAAFKAADEIKKRLLPVAVKLLQKKGAKKTDDTDIQFENGLIFDARDKKSQITFSELATAAYMTPVSLGQHGYYHTPGVQFDREKGKGSPFYYFVQGACVTQVEVDILSGKHKLLKVHIVHDVGKGSLNDAIDRGQITGAFFQGYGWCTLEELNYDGKGKYKENTLSAYKIPTIRELPEVFDITLYEHNCERASIFGSKGIGEPPFLYGIAAHFAIRDAIESITDDKEKVELRHPAVPSAVLAALAKH